MNNTRRTRTRTRPAIDLNDSHNERRSQKTKRCIIKHRFANIFVRSIVRSALTNLSCLYISVLWHPSKLECIKIIQSSKQLYYSHSHLIEGETEAKSQTNVSNIKRLGNGRVTSQISFVSVCEELVSASSYSVINERVLFSSHRLHV